MIHALHQCANVIAGNVVSITQQYIERNKHLIRIFNCEKKMETLRQLKIMVSFVLFFIQHDTKKSCCSFFYLSCSFHGLKFQSAKIYVELQPYHYQKNGVGRRRLYSKKYSRISGVCFSDL